MPKFKDFKLGTKLGYSFGNLVLVLYRWCYYYSKLLSDKQKIPPVIRECYPLEYATRIAFSTSFPAFGVVGIQACIQPEGTKSCRAVKEGYFLF